MLYILVLVAVIAFIASKNSSPKNSTYDYYKQEYDSYMKEKRRNNRQKQGKHIISWGLSILFVLLGLLAMFSGYSAGFILVLCGLVIHPVFRRRFFLKTWTAYLICVFLLLLAIGVFSVGSKSAGDSSAPATPETVVSASEDISLPKDPNGENIQQEDPQTEDVQQPDFNEFQDSVAELLSSTYGENYILEMDETAATVIIWADGLYQTALSAKNLGKNSEARKNWDTSVFNMVDLTNYINELSGGYGYKDYSCMVLIVNEDNHDTILAMITNGSIAYDAVTAE